MRSHRCSAILLIAVLLSAFEGVYAKNFLFAVEHLDLPISTLERTGLDGVFLPHEYTGETNPPKRKPLDSKQPLRGKLTPQQLAVILRSLSVEKIITVQSPPRSSPEGTSIDVPKEGNSPTPLSVSAAPLPGNKIQVKISGSDFSAIQDVAVLPEDTLVLSLPGKEPDSISIYLIKVSSQP